MPKKKVSAGSGLASFGSKSKGVINIGEFMGGMVNFARGLNGLGRSIHYWSDDGQGKMSRALSQSSFEYVSNVFADAPGFRKQAGVAGKNRIPSRATGKKSSPERYAAWKKKAGFGDTPRLLDRTSSDRLRMDVTKGGGNINFGPDDRVKTPVPLTNPVRYMVSNLTVPEYNFMGEMAQSNKYAIIGPALKYWMGEYAPEWEKSFTKMINKVYEDAAAVVGQSKSEHKQRGSAKESASDMTTIGDIKSSSGVRVFASEGSPVTESKYLDASGKVMHSLAKVVEDSPNKKSSDAEMKKELAAMMAELPPEMRKKAARMVKTTTLMAKDIANKNKG